MRSEETIANYQRPFFLWDLVLLISLRFFLSETQIEIFVWDRDKITGVFTYCLYSVVLGTGKSVLRTIEKPNLNPTHGCK